MQLALHNEHSATLNVIALFSSLMQQRILSLQGKLNVSISFENILKPPVKVEPSR